MTTILDPWMLLLGLLVPIAAGLKARRGTAAVRFAPARLAGRDLPRSWRTLLVPLPRVLQVLGLLGIVIALSRPAYRVPLPRTTEGIDILLCLDVSSSMATNDMDPKLTRLDLAKQAATSFSAGRPHDRIGLLCFARYPDLVCPLTLDQTALADFLAGVDHVEADGAEDMTGIGTAVARAAQVLRTSLANSKVVILLTDGEENVATRETPNEIGPAKAARLCERLGVRVYTVAAGIGKRRRTGEWVPVDTTQVSRLAERTGGAFFAARDATAIAAVYTTIDELERSRFEGPRYRIEDRFLPFLSTAVLLLLLGRCLAGTVFRVLP
ncbi:MAG: VWA domain-containing protein [Planctomycetota bacterium]|nr:VWA domain-containing protein [Planctomycetota bacterium]